MSEITFYDSTIQLFVGGLTTMIGLLKKAQEQPNASTLPSAKLHEDMKPLSYQVECVVKTISRILVRAANIDTIQTMDCDGKTLEELIAFTEKNLAILKGVTPKDMEAKQDTKIELPMGTFTGKQFVFGFGIPSFFFHLQTAYSILRMKGVPIGKEDFVGSFKEQHGA